MALPPLLLFQNDQRKVSFYTVPARKAPIVVTSEQSGWGRVWDVSRVPRVVSEFRLEPYHGDWPYAYTALASPDGKQAFIVDPDLTRGGFRVVRLSPFQTLWRSASPHEQLTQTEWSPDGRLLLVPGVGPRRISRVVRASDGRTLGTIPILSPYAFAKGLVYGTSGLIGVPTGILGVDLQTRRVVRRIVDPTVEDEPVGVSPDGRYLVSGGRDRSGAHFRYRVWRAATGRKVAEFAGEGRSRTHPFDPVFLSHDRFALLYEGVIRRNSDGRVMGRVPPLPYEPGWVWVRTPGKPLRPRRVDL